MMWTWEILLLLLAVLDPPKLLSLPLRQSQWLVMKPFGVRVLVGYSPRSQQFVVVPAAAANMF